MVEDPNGKTFTVSSRVEFRVTKEDNEAEVTCTVDHESLQNSERSTTQKLQVHCTWRVGITGQGHMGKGTGLWRGGKDGGGLSITTVQQTSHTWPYVYTFIQPSCIHAYKLINLHAQWSCHAQGHCTVTLPLHMHTFVFPCLSPSP